MAQVLMWHVIFERHALWFVGWFSHVGPFGPWDLWSKSIDLGGRLNLKAMRVYKCEAFLPPAQACFFQTGASLLLCACISLRRDTGSMQPP